MKKETNKIIERGETISDVMKKHNAVFSITLEEGFAHIGFEENEMYVEWLNEEGYQETEGTRTGLKDVVKIAEFMRDLKSLKLENYSNIIK